MPPTKNPLPREQIFAIVQEEFGELVAEAQTGVREPHIVLDPARANEGDRFVKLMEFCRDDPRLSFDLLSVVSGVDYPDRGVIEVLYFLDSTVHNHWLPVKVPLPRDEPQIPSVENIWRTADWHERETWDLLGVVFRGHHNLVRILCAEDWVGHPLRKDYVTPDTYHGMKNVVY